MPTSDRTTIHAAADALASKLRDGLLADPLTAEKPFRRVVVGAHSGEAFARPFLSLAVTGARPIGSMDDDRLFSVSMTLSVFADVLTPEASDTLLALIGAVEDALDGLIDTGVVEGADGFDDRAWTLTYPRTTSAARLASASATQSFVVRVARGFNRVAAE